MLVGTGTWHGVKLHKENLFDVKLDAIRRVHEVNGEACKSTAMQMY